MKNRMNYVLVLNRIWLPVEIVHFKDAFRLLAKEAAKALDVKNDYMLLSLDQWIDLHTIKSKYDRKIHTVKFQIPIPEIIVLEDYDQMPKRLVTFGKENLLIRDDFKCAYCQCELSLDNMTVDHVVPRARGGITSWENCVSSCSRCNFLKADNLPHQEFKPRANVREPNSVSVIYRLHHKIKSLNYPESWDHFLMKK